MEHSGIEQKVMNDDRPPSAAVAVWAARYAPVSISKIPHTLRSHIYCDTAVAF